MGGKIYVIWVLWAVFITTLARLCPDPTCPEDEHDNKTVLLPSRDCSTFFSCVLGFPTLLACPPGLRFNETLPGCVPEEMADCSQCEDEIKTDNEVELPQQNEGVFQLLNYFRMPYN